MDYSRLRNGTDVRGIAVAGVLHEDVNLTEQAARDISRAFCLWLKRKLGKRRVRVAVGYDSRISAPVLLAGVQEGVTFGDDLVVTGLSSTPSMFMLLQDEPFFSARGGAIDGSVMITASHLPFNRNGLKFFTRRGGLEADDVKEILAVAGDEAALYVSGERGTVTTHYYMDKYSADLVQKVRAACGTEKPLSGKKILVDAGGGAGGFYAEKVLVPLGADIGGSQFLEPDGYFKGHIPNPENEAAMASVCAAVKREKADFGIIFDTDVDRAGAVDSAGEEINRNRLIALISAILLAERPGTIVTDSVTSDGLAQFIVSHGGRHHRFKRGYKNVINEAIRLNAAGEYTPLAIETSGHAALKENYFLDDGAYLITRLLIALAKVSEQGKKLTDLISDLKMPEEATELRFKFKDGCDFTAEGARIIGQLKIYAAEKDYITPAKENYEGVRLNFDTAHGAGWLLVRMSLHEPILPVNAESEKAGGVKEIIGGLYEFLKDFDCLDLSPAETFLKG
ncbi:MAG: hypothetical protein SPH68_03465 [Candidatus Borkfalkiaceae bacterium]|nr:phosphomannomutase/phosphoglucomutase [Clostridia bacterium]MDY6223204.1 hypothetical protein [Christensenellaceae bacterium]